MLTPNTHLLVGGIVIFASFSAFILVWQFVIQFLLPENWNKTAVMMAAFLVIVPIPVLIFDKLVPARCPRCDGEMFGSSFRPAYKECKSCKYYYGYSIFGNN